MEYPKRQGEAADTDANKITTSRNDSKNNARAAAVAIRIIKSTAQQQLSSPRPEKPQRVPFLLPAPSVNHRTTTSHGDPASYSSDPHGAGALHCPPVASTGNAESTTMMAAPAPAPFVAMNVQQAGNNTPQDRQQAECGTTNTTIYPWIHDLLVMAAAQAQQSAASKQLWQQQEGCLVQDLLQLLVMLHQQQQQRKDKEQQQHLLLQQLSQALREAQRQHQLEQDLHTLVNMMILPLQQEQQQHYHPASSSLSSFLMSAMTTANDSSVATTYENVEPHAVAASPTAAPIISPSLTEKASDNPTFSSSFVLTLHAALSSQQQQRVSEAENNCKEIRSTGDAIVFAWKQHGQAFSIYLPRVFEARILPRYFGHLHGCQTMRNFKAQLRDHAFSKVTSGPDKNGTRLFWNCGDKRRRALRCFVPSSNSLVSRMNSAYYHPLFQRDHPDLSSGIRCSSRHKRQQQQSSFSSLGCSSSAAPSVDGNASAPADDCCIDAQTPDLPNYRDTNFSNVRKYKKAKYRHNLNAGPTLGGNNDDSNKGGRPGIRGTTRSTNPMTDMSAGPTSTRDLHSYCENVRKIALKKPPASAVTCGGIAAGTSGTPGITTTCGGQKRTTTTGPPRSLIPPSKQEAADGAAVTDGTTSTATTTDTTSSNQCKLMIGSARHRRKKNNVNDNINSKATTRRKSRSPHNIIIPVEDAYNNDIVFNDSPRFTHDAFIVGQITTSAKAKEKASQQYTLQRGTETFAAQLARKDAQTDLWHNFQQALKSSSSSPPLAFENKWKVNHQSHGNSIGDGASGSGPRGNVCRSPTPMGLNHHIQARLDTHEQSEFWPRFQQAKEGSTFAKKKKGSYQSDAGGVGIIGDAADRARSLGSHVECPLSTAEATAPTGLDAGAFSAIVPEEPMAMLWESYQHALRSSLDYKVDVKGAGEDARDGHSTPSTKPAETSRISGLNNSTDGALDVAGAGLASLAVTTATTKPFVSRDSNTRMPDSQTMLWENYHLALRYGSVQTNKDDNPSGSAHSGHDVVVLENDDEGTKKKAETKPECVAESSGALDAAVVLASLSGTATKLIKNGTYW